MNGVAFLSQASFKLMRFQKPSVFRWPEMKQNALSAQASSLRFHLSAIRCFCLLFIHNEIYPLKRKK